MIIYNLGRIYRARGIGDPSSFLRKNGISNGSAWKLSKNKVEGLQSALLGKLCEVLYCTPNDLVEWIPDRNSNFPSDHPIQSLRNRDEVDMTGMLKSFPIEKMNKVRQFLEQEIGSVKGKATLEASTDENFDPSGEDKASGKASNEHTAKGSAKNSNEGSKKDS